MTVRLYERSVIAAGASGRNSGVVQHPFDGVMADLYRRTIDEYRQFDRDRDGGFRLSAEPAGILYVGWDEAQARTVAAQWSAAWPATSPEVLVGEQLRSVEPALAPDLVAVRLAIGFPVAPSAATEAFAARAVRLERPAELRLHSEAAPAIVDDRAVGVRTAAGVEAAGAVVVAAGPWTPGLIDPDGAWLPIRRVWGVVAGISLDDAPRHGLEAIDID